MSSDSDEITLDEYEKLIKKKAKHNNRKVVADGQEFDSEAEYCYYRDVLKLRMAEESIRDLEFHPTFELIPGYRRKDGKKIRPVFYEADFGYVENVDAERTVIDVKGQFTAVFKIKLKILQWRYPDLRFQIVKAHYKRGRWEFE